MEKIFDWNNVKPRRYYFCRSSLHLYIAFKTVRIENYTSDGLGGRFELSREKKKEIIRSFKGNVDDCRCPDCRYHRLYQRLMAKKSLVKEPMHDDFGYEDPKTK